MAGWALILGYVTTGIAVVAGCASYATIVLNRLHVQVGPYVLYAIVAGVAWAIAYRDVRLSAKLVLLLEITSIGLILLLGAVVVARQGISLDVQHLGLREMDLSGLRSGLVLAIFSFVGFESATTLGAEAREPRKTIPRAVLLSTMLSGAFYVIIAFIMVGAFRDYPTPLDKTPAVLDVMAEMAHMPALGSLLSLGAMISFFACGLACLTAVSRVLLSMARDGVIHASIGRAHDMNATPHVATTLAAAALFIVPAVMTAQGIGILDIYGLNGTIATYGFLVAYVLIAEGVLATAHRRTIGIPVVAAAGVGIFLMLVAVAGSLYPWPAEPYSALPPIFAMYMAGGAAWLFYDRRSGWVKKRPT
jgi:amino acid transporter